MCSLLHEAVETKISPFSNQNFDTENHYCLIECYVHEIEGHHTYQPINFDLLD